MRLRVTLAAAGDLEAIDAFLERDSPASAASVLLRLMEAIEGLLVSPSAGRPGRVPGTRELIVTGLPYVVPYRVQDDTVEVLRILHAARPWPPPS